MTCSDLAVDAVLIVGTVGSERRRLKVVWSGAVVRGSAARAAIAASVNPDRQAAAPPQETPSPSLSQTDHSADPCTTITPGFEMFPDRH